MRFRLVPKSMTLDDCYKFKFSPNLLFWEATKAKRMKIDPYYQRQKCSPMILVSRNIRCMWIFAGVPLGGAPGASNNSGVVDDGNFWQFAWLLLPKRQR